jgi:transcriptional regulator with XRE-family HTH domain
MARPPAAKWPSRIFREKPRFGRAARALGLRIRQLREKHEWTLERAASEMEIDLTHLQKIEAGKLNVTLVSLLRIADGLGEPVHDLLSGVPSKKRSASS